MDAKDIALIKALGGGGSGSSITVDSELSDTSTNPVQNQVVKSALDNLETAMGSYITDVASLVGGDA